MKENPVENPLDNSDNSIEELNIENPCVQVDELMTEKDERVSDL